LIFNTLWLEGPTPDPIMEMQQKRLSNPISMSQIQKVAASPPSFPVNLVVLVDRIKFDLDLGQSFGTTGLEIHKLQISNRKCSEHHHSIFFHMHSLAAESKGRFSGYMNAKDFMLQTSIYFPPAPDQQVSTPLVQIDAKLEYVEFRASFEYHVFLIGDGSRLRFTIYNRRVIPSEDRSGDRLVLHGDPEQIRLYATAEGPALVISLYKALIQLKDEKQQSRAKELESFLEGDRYLGVATAPQSRPSLVSTSPILGARVDTEMSIKFSKINIGIFKAALNDSPVFRVNVANIRALFSHSIIGRVIENRLNMSLGTLGIALSPLKRIGGQELGEMKVEKWIKHASTMRGGVILAVPETEGSMWTKQEEDSDVVEHIYKSKLDGKVDIGWNYGSVIYVQDLWKTFQLKMKQGEERTTQPTKNEEPIHTHIRDTTAPGETIEPEPTTVPDNKFHYVAIEPAIIDTPQLRQMGDATPPMEWIGVNRMKLPAFTHQAFIVPLQTVSKKVERVYNLTLQSGIK
jgi:hypothetical protein